MAVTTNGSGSRTTTDIEVVEGFLGALERLDIDAAMAFCDADVTYQNVPLPPARGKAATEKQLRFLSRYGSGFRAVIHAIAANDDGVVLTERTDVIEVGRFKPAFWVCGRFDVRNGKIVGWKDYFDYADVTVSLVRAGFKALLGRDGR
jgi:limonene-1,2-epoxide hydrolase